MTFAVKKQKKYIKLFIEVFKQCLIYVSWNFWSNIRFFFKVIFAIGGESNGMASRSAECFKLGYDKWKYVVPMCTVKRNLTEYTSALPPLRCARYYAASANNMYKVYVMGKYSFSVTYFILTDSLATTDSRAQGRDYRVSLSRHVLSSVLHWLLKFEHIGLYCLPTEVWSPTTLLTNVNQEP